jgi:hypothetical protein
LSEKDNYATEAISEPGRAGDWQPGLATRTVQVTPDGHSLVFMSNEDLTGYDSYAGPPLYSQLEEVYVYEAETGSLFCASCNKSGEAPQPNSVAEKRVAAYLPVSWDNTRLPSVISDDGSRVFFDSDQPLVPQDTNGEQGVYEWERDGSGNCRESDGCVYLLSGGASKSSTFLIGSDSTGNNVFMVSRERFVPGPSNGAYDVYDARVGATPVSPPECTGTGCQGLPTPPPTFATPPSVTFNGVGNFPAPASVTPTVKQKAKPLTRRQKLARALKACERLKAGKKQAVCEAQARKRYGSTAKVKSRKGGK